ncbi:Solute carrier family 25 member 36 [Portunus trituberculatus]|uniref:Solute carrier family 25 member 36 n=1 Tax=Portunus trituberculatus TaxID=210409 RepID=A0A5B7IHM4_PORTR|nr:Solute carrier family 25 member 36 [Portunus trituberculatus]
MGSNRDTFIHLFAGKCDDTMGTVATCLQKVVKTRLQFSSFNYISGSLPPPTAQQQGSTTCPIVPQNHHR